MHKLVPGLAFPKTIPKLFPNCSQTVFVTHVLRAQRALYSVSMGAKAMTSNTPLLQNVAVLDCVVYSVAALLDVVFDRL